MNEVTLYPNIPVKDIAPTLKLISELQAPATYTIDIPLHHLNRRKLALKHGPSGFNFKVSSKVIKGLQDHKELFFEREIVYTLLNKKRPLYFEGKHFLLKSINYSDDSQKLLAGGIAGFSSSPDRSILNNCFLRLIVPVKKGDFKLDSFQDSFFRVLPNSYHHFMDIEFDKKEFHLYPFKVGNSHFVVVDAVTPSTLKEFQKDCYNIFLAYAFLTGSMLTGECYFLSYVDKAMSIPKDFIYLSVGKSLITNQPTYTMNAYSMYPDVESLEKDPKTGAFTQESNNKLYDGLDGITKVIFSKLVKNFENEKVQRSALLFIEGHAATLEVRLPCYFVALEALSAYVVDNFSETKPKLSPIKNKKVAERLIKLFKDETTKAKSENNLSDIDFNIEILFKNIDKLNAPPNADKLSESFSLLGYTITSEQRKILKERNTYLHGSFVKTIEDDVAFRTALYIGLRAHFLVAVAILKSAGFSGKIINYAKLWSHITEKDVQEDNLISI